MKYRSPKSLKGHDKGKIYKILSFDERTLTLTDDKGKVKKKNRKHVQLIKGDMNV